MDQITQTVIEKTISYFSPATVMVEMSARLAEMEALSCTDNNQLELYTLGVLKFYPQVSMFFIGDERGNYIRAWRLPQGKMEGRIIDRASSPPADTLKHWNNELQLLKTEKLTDLTYDPRVRPWYIGAKETKATFWTDIYILFRNKKPAITLAHPVLDKNGKVSAVWGMDIELDAMSTFLKELKIGKNGIALIMNAKNELVGYPDSSRIIMEEKGVLRPVHINEFTCDNIAVAFREHSAKCQSKSVIEIEGKRYFASFTEFPQSFPAQWKIGLLMPQDDFISAARQLMQETLLICLAILLIAIFMAFLLARGISQPIKYLAQETKKIKDFHLDDKIAIKSHIKEIQLMTNAIASMKTGLKSFRRYVPADLVRQLIHTGDEAALGGVNREITIIMSDLRGFTALTAEMAPEEVISFLNRYLSRMIEILLEYGAVIDEIIGDGILAFLGAPEPMEDHPARAVACALKMQMALEEINAQNEVDGFPHLEMGIAVNTGQVVVGNIGSEKRTKYGLVGAQVNFTGRIESYTVGGQVLISPSTYGRVQDLVDIRQSFAVTMKGLPRPVTLYEVQGIGGAYHLQLLDKCDAPVPLGERINIHLYRVKEKVITEPAIKGWIEAICGTKAVLYLESELLTWEDICIRLVNEVMEELSGRIYAKVEAAQATNNNHYEATVRFTSVAPEIYQIIRQQQHMGGAGL
jgi:class 3 adenylate cyclase